MVEKKLFSGSWKHTRCLIPASGFFEKNYRIRKENYETFWLGGIWSKWSSPDGAELESCCVLTTKPNDLVKPLHHRMPVIVPNGYMKQEELEERSFGKDSSRVLVLAMSCGSMANPSNTQIGPIKVMRAIHGHQKG